MKRRTVIGGGLVVLGAGAYMAHTMRPKLDTRILELGSNEMTTKPAATRDKLDIHHLVIPPFASRNGTEEWSADKAIRWMDSQSIACSMLSIDPVIYSGSSAKEAAELSRACNQYLSQQVQEHPGRFGMLATLPLHRPEDAITELDYAYDTLRADGVAIAASHAGMFLGEQHFQSLFAELNQRKVPTLVLPGRHPTTDNLLLSNPEFFVEHTCEVTRAAVNLIFSQSLDKYPDIRWILSNGGGFLPFIAWRLSLANLMPELKDATEHGILHYIKRFWIDTTLSSNPATMAALEELMEPDKLLFGSGYPQVQHEQTALAAHSTHPSRFSQGIEQTHALRLFPRLG